MGQEFKNLFTILNEEGFFEVLFYFGIAVIVGYFSIWLFTQFIYLCGFIISLMNQFLLTKIFIPAVIIPLTVVSFYLYLLGIGQLIEFFK